MVVINVKVELQTTLCFLPCRCPVCCDGRVVLQFLPSKYEAHQQSQSPTIISLRIFVLDSRLGTASVDGPRILMEGIGSWRTTRTSQQTEQR